jgi:ribosomal protein L36
MKVRASIKKRSADSKIVRRKGTLCMISKKKSQVQDRDRDICVILNYLRKVIYGTIVGLTYKEKKGEIGLTSIYV